MITEKDKKFREALLLTLKLYKVDDTLLDELVFWITKDAKRIYLDKEL